MPRIKPPSGTLLVPSGNQMSRQKNKQQEERETETDNALLRLVGTDPGRPLGEYDNTLGLTPFKREGALQRLREQGLIRVERSTEDRRIRVPVLTPRGEERLRELPEQEPLERTGEETDQPWEDSEEGSEPAKDEKVTSHGLVVLIPGDPDHPNCKHPIRDIEPPNGPTSTGRCRVCGEVRDGYLNFLPDLSRWEDTRTPREAPI